MASRSKDITFVVPGLTQAATTTGRGRNKAAVRVGAQRGDGPAQRVTARPGEDVVVLTLANGPTLVLSPESARDLLRAQASGASRGDTRSAAGAVDEDEVQVGAQLGWPGLEAAGTRGVTRGWLGQAVLAAFEVITGAGKAPLVALAASAITKKLDGRVDAGVYNLSPDALPATLKGSGLNKIPVPAAADGGPLLVLVHGTFVDTVHTFGKLWDLHGPTVRELFERYGNRVYALDHPTMGASPIANALTLVAAMPPGARLHLLTHSRGGLVAEVLARACAGQALTTDERALFADGRVDARYAPYLKEIEALIKAAAAKGLKVERVVRVACPARGTLLASRRFDAYLSVLKWGLELSALPVAAELVDFLHEVALRRADPAELPGIEAMMPESPIVAWLNGGSESLPGELRVVAGDMQGDSIGSWVKTLLSDAFYWTDNDLVVQTRSMYGGCPRAASVAGDGASFILDRGAKVSHFNYFSNQSSVDAIAHALLQDKPADFSSIGPLSWAGKSAEGTRAARAVARSRGKDGGGDGGKDDTTTAAERPAVFVLPGILGSNLKLDGKRIWLGLRFVNGLKRLAWDPATAARVEADGPIGSVYDDLIERLADTHEVIPFAFDWRRPLEDEARRLADAVDEALSARATSHQPVRLLAHSMGGLVARTMRLERPETWQRLMAREGGRLLMLGTPNGGSWAPMQTLSGDDTFGNALVFFGSLFDNGGARKMMAGMPGFIQLQASLLDPALNLDKASTWQKLADDDMANLQARSIWHSEGPQKSIYEWGAPPQAVLDQAVALRKRLDEQAANLGADAQKMLLVVGHADFTPAGYEISTEGLEYLDTPDDGDGRVTQSSAMLPDVRTWKIDAEHGKLPSVARAFAAYVELLSTGQTALLESVQTTSRSGGAAAIVRAVAAQVRSRPSRGLMSSRPPSGEIDIFGLARDAAPSTRQGGNKAATLQVSVLNGNLKFVRQPLLVGHYRSLKLTGTEEVVDGLVNQSMSLALAAGLYPTEPGTHQIFSNHRADPDNQLDMARPVAAIVAGLGDEGKLRALELVRTVRQAVLAFAQRVAEQEPSATQFEMAATLIASGGTGISAGTAAQQIAQGAMEANQRLQGSRWPTLNELLLVELYLDRAAEAWHALQLLQSSAPQRLKVVGKVQFGAGALRRSLDSSYRGAAYDFISALASVGPDKKPCIAYTLDTKRARTEVRAQQAQVSLLSELVANASNDAQQDSQIGRTLFNLLVPVEMEPFLSGTSEMLIEVNSGTAVIPWELLDTRADTESADLRPWAIRCKLLRKLQTEDFRQQVNDASVDDNVLVIGEPLCDRDVYPSLPGARAEAVAVAKRLAEPGSGLPPERIRALTSGQDDARTVINALFERNYRVVHVAGHGEPGADGGVVLSGKKTYLGANEVRAMRVVPELVFLNCCHLAGRDAASTLKLRYDRAGFAANIAEALIKVGVRCVIAAGWAVDDGPAETFATTFYASLLGGARFIEAVATARNAAWRENPRGNTWAAYQCYGDPDWCWQRDGHAGKQATAPLSEQYAAVASPLALTLALETLAVKSEYSSTPRQGQLDKLRFLDSQFAPLWGSMGAVAEAFGAAYAGARDLDKAVAWYQVAVDADDGSASFKAAEQLGNCLVRRNADLDKVDADVARKDIRQAIQHLQRLVAVKSTAERCSLLGSAYKRLTMVEDRAKRSAEAAAALAAAAKHYAAAEDIARKNGAADLFDPAKAGIGCELRFAFISGKPCNIAEARLIEVRNSLRQAAKDSPDFWSVVGITELTMLAAAAAGKLAPAAPALIDTLRKLKERVPAPKSWDSVHNEALFVLQPYQAQASSAEKRAAADVLAALKTLAAA